MKPITIALSVLLLAPDPIRTGRTVTGIAYDVQGTGPAVVLITGANLDRRMWDAEAGWLKSQFTVIRYDLRAHGQSDVPRAPFSHVNDLFEVLDELHIDTAALIGLSAGSSIALDAALQSPDRITRLVLTAPGISGYSATERPRVFTPLVPAIEAGEYVKAAEVLPPAP